jgi:DNA-binding GntR family transcriptional regulator
MDDATEQAEHMLEQTDIEMATLEIGQRPELLTKAVYDAIRQAILDRRIKPGERVTEASLAAKLSVSKTPVREALLELRRVGLIVQWGKRGGSVIEPSREAFLEISEMREAIEVFVTTQAAHRANQEHKRMITELALASKQQAINQNVDKFHQLNVGFHRCIAMAAGNARLAELLVDVLDLNSLLRKRDLPPLNNLNRLAKEHIDIAHCIETGDAAGAAEFARNHVTQAREENLRAFEQLTTPHAH